MKKSYLIFFRKLNKFIGTLNIEEAVDLFVKSNPKYEKYKNKIIIELYVLSFGIGLVYLKKLDSLEIHEISFLSKYVANKYLNNYKLDLENKTRKNCYATSFLSSDLEEEKDKFGSVTSAMGEILGENQWISYKKNNVVHLESPKSTPLSAFLKNQVMKNNKYIQEKFENTKKLIQDKLIVSSLIIFVGLCVLAYSIAYSNRYVKMSDYRVYDKWKNETIDIRTGEYLKKR